MTTARVYGLNIDSELPLHERRPHQGETDLVIRLGDPMASTDEEPEGRRLLEVAVDQQYFAAFETSTGYLLRFHGTCDFQIDSELRTVTAHVLPGTDLDRVSVLAAGTALSFVLIMRGHAVLHASAVQFGDAALAFVGRSGMGKSTMATLMCADGARLITDDVLRLDLDKTPPTCSLGPTELRLRKAAAELSQNFSATPETRLTGDDRDALRVLSAVTDDLPLCGIVIPVPDHEDTSCKPEVVRLTPKVAMLHLLQYPRIAGWEDLAVLDRQFDEVARVVESVPVYAARMPWGPPFPPGMAATVRDFVWTDQVRPADSTAAR